jgi:glutamate dehydrogenase (NAD(P)+)
MVATRSALSKLKISPVGATTAVQGFGNVGSISAKLLASQGMKVLAISDVSGAYHNTEGIDIEAAIAYRDNNNGTLEGFTGGSKITNSDLLELEVDVLVPAAMEDQITAENADRIKAKVIVEGANGPTSASADTILNKKGIMVVPDILANAGGVTVSYFEWVQNRLGYFWTEERVYRRADRVMKTAFEAVYQASIDNGCSLRIAAYVVAISKVAEVEKLRGKFGL